MFFRTYKYCVLFAKLHKLHHISPEENNHVFLNSDDQTCVSFISSSDNSDMVSLEIGLVRNKFKIF